MTKTITNPIVKDEVTFVQTAASTNGRITTLQVTLMPGGGTPLHYHRNFSETFVVLEGALTIVLTDKVVLLTAGQKITVEKGVSHSFANRSSSPVIFTTIITPGSEGFENALRILYGLARDGKTDAKGTPKNLLVLTAVSTLSDMRLAGPARLFAPLFGLFNLIARMAGVHKKLLTAYCQD